jgi:hypothetical protein
MAIALLTLALTGTLALLGANLHGYLVPQAGVEMKRHFLYALVTTTLLVMAHSFILFFLLATGVEMKELEQARGWGDSFRRRTVALKGRVFPAATLTLLLVIFNFVLGAAAHTRALPAWTHEGLAWLTFAACVVTLWREYQALGTNNQLIAEAARRRAAPAETA